MNPDWLEFPGCEFEICGIDGSSVKFDSRLVLDKRVLFTGVIAFSVTAVVNTWEFSFNTCSFTIVDYGGLRRFRDEIDALCRGARQSATIGAHAAKICVRQHQFGVRERLLVEGEWSSHGEVAAKSHRERDALANFVVVENEPAISGRFAFITACIDPPNLVSTVAQMDEVLRVLESAGFQP